MLNRRNGFILGLLLCILVVEIVILSPKDVGAPTDDQASAESELIERTAQHTMGEVSSVGSKGEKKEWELNAARALRQSEEEGWVIEKVKVKFFGENGVTYTVTGQQGDVDVKKNNIRISGDVVTRSSNGYTFKTNQVFYDSGKRRLNTPDNIIMIGPSEADGSNLELTGTELLADLESNEIFIAKNVKARKGVKGNKVAKISSRKAEFSGKTNSARFIGAVVIEMDTVQIAGPKAEFVYDKAGGKVDSMTVDGGVRVTDSDKWATSEKVSVHFEEDRFVFNGSPRVVQSGDELLGDEIVFLDGGKRVQVSNARAKIDSAAAQKAGR